MQPKLKTFATPLLPSSISSGARFYIKELISFLDFRDSQLTNFSSVHAFVSSFMIPLTHIL